MKLKDRAILCVKSGDFMVFPTNQPLELFLQVLDGRFRLFR